MRFHKIHEILRWGSRVHYGENNACIAGLHSASFMLNYEPTCILRERTTEGPVVFLKTTCWLQHITQGDVRMLVYGTDAWFRAAPQDSPRMRSEGQRTGDLGCNQGFWVAEMQIGFHVGVCFNHLTISATWVLNDCSLWIFMLWSEAAAMHKACWGIFR